MLLKIFEILIQVNQNFKKEYPFFADKNKSCKKSVNSCKILIIKSFISRILNGEIKKLFLNY